jgi:hypothetical protein
MNYSEILGAAKYHHAIRLTAHFVNAISTQPRKSHHSFTGYCVDVYFDNSDELIRFQKMIEYIINHFVAISYNPDFARVRVPCR